MNLCKEKKKKKKGKTSCYLGPIKTPMSIIIIYF